MTNKIKLKIEGDKATIGKGSSSLLNKLIAGSQGKIKIKTPFGEQEIHEVKDQKGRVIKQRLRE